MVFVLLPAHFKRFIVFHTQNYFSFELSSIIHTVLLQNQPLDNIFIRWRHYALTKKFVYPENMFLQLFAILYKLNIYFYECLGRASKFLYRGQTPFMQFMDIFIFVESATGHPIVDTLSSVRLSFVRLSGTRYPPAFWNGVDWRAVVED